jgi:hypothetical protein
VKNESLTGYQAALAALKVGDTVGIKSGTGASKKIYRLAQVTFLTKAQIVTDGGRFWKARGNEVAGLSHIEIMSPNAIKKWHAAKEAEKRKADLRLANYNPADHDDHVQAALRALRDKARSLCEHLQVQVENRLNAGAPAPDWWPEYLQMLVQIEESENALKSIGLSTTLKPSSEQRSLFK